MPKQVEHSDQWEVYEEQYQEILLYLNSEEERMM